MKVWIEYSSQSRPHHNKIVLLFSGTVYLFIQLCLSTKFSLVHSPVFARSSLRHHRCCLHHCSDGHDDVDVVDDDDDDDVVVVDDDDDDDDDVLITALTPRWRWSSRCGSRCGRRPPSSSGIILVIGSRHQHRLPMSVTVSIFLCNVCWHERKV